jgi:hypothetical protein
VKIAYKVVVKIPEWNILLEKFRLSWEDNIKMG